MRSVIFIIGYCFIEVVCSHWGVKVPLSDNALIGTLVFACILDLTRK